MGKTVKIPLMALTLLVGFMACSQNSSQKSSSILSYNKNPLVNISPGVIPSEGNKNAKAELAVFFDPYCPPCRRFDAQLSELMKDPNYKDRVLINYHLFALGDDHFPNDVKASLIHLEMAKKGLFSTFRNTVVKENINDIEQMRALAETLGKKKLPDAVLNQNMSLFDQEARIAANKKIQQTPTIFMNNREVEIQDLDDLKKLIDYVESKS